MGLARRLSRVMLREGLPLTLLFFCAVGCGQSFHDVAARGDLDALRKMAADEPDVIHSRNKMEKTPLHYAVTNRQNEVIVWLIGAGADVNARDITGMTPLHVAATMNSHKQAAALLKEGADMTLRDDFGDTPLHSAAMHGKMDVLRLLAVSGATIDTRNSEGLTAAGLALRHRQREAADYLAQWAE